MAADEDLTGMDSDEMRRRCWDIVDRLPSIIEFNEWARRLDEARTEESLEGVAGQLVRLVQSYRRYGGLDVMARQPLTWGRQLKRGREYGSR